MTSCLGLRLLTQLSHQHRQAITGHQLFITAPLLWFLPSSVKAVADVKCITTASMGLLRVACKSIHTPWTFPHFVTNVNIFHWNQHKVAHNLISVQIQLFCDGLRDFLREYWGGNGIMKSREKARQVKDKVVETFKAGLGFKKISQTLKSHGALFNPSSGKWKEYGTAADLPRHGRPPKLTGRTRRALIRDAANCRDPQLRWDESVHRTTIGCLLHKSGLYGRVARRKP